MDEKSLLEIKKTILESLSFLKEGEDFETAANKAKKNWGGELEPDEEFDAEEFFGDAGDAAEEDIKSELGDDEFASFGTMEDPRMLKDLEEDEEVGSKGLFKPQDSEGNDVNISSLVKHVDSEKTGRVLGFGDDGQGSLIVRVNWAWPTDMKFTDPKEMGEKREAPEHLIVQSLSESEEEEYVTVCGECGEEMGPDITSGDEGWSICSGCGAIEGPTEEIPRSEYENNQDKNSIRENDDIDAELSLDNLHFDKSNLYKWILDAMHQLDVYSKEDIAMAMEKAFERDYDYKLKMNEMNEINEEKKCKECGGEIKGVKAGDEIIDVCEECGAQESGEEVNEEICDTDASEGDELDEARGLGAGVKNSGNRNVKLRDDHHKAPLTNLNESVNNSIKNLLEGSVTKKTLKEFIAEEAKKIANNLRG